MNDEAQNALHKAAAILKLLAGAHDHVPDAIAPAAWAALELIEEAMAELDTPSERQAA